MERPFVAACAEPIAEEGERMASYRIAVVGEKDSVLGFQALGLDVFPAGGAD